MNGGSYASSSSTSASLLEPYYAENNGRVVKRHSGDVGAGCFFCDLVLPRWLQICDAPTTRQERQSAAKSYFGSLLHANNALKYEEDGELVRLTEQLDKLKRAKNHVTYGPTKKRLDSKIKQLQAELDEVVETVLVG